MNNKFSKKIEKTTFDNFFSLSNDNLEVSENAIIEIDIEKLIEYSKHPFKVLKDSDDMTNLITSISENGILVPLIVRELNDKYEIISGHRRKFACSFLNIKKIPVIVKQLDDNETIITMVDSNIQREELLFSEKAFAYKMKFDAIKKKSTNNRTIDKNKDYTNEISNKQIYRYIRLTELIPELLDKVDKKDISFTSAVELSYLIKKSQKILFEIIEEKNIIPTLEQSKVIKLKDQESPITKQIIETILSSKEKKYVTKIILKNKKIKEYFSEEYSQKDIENIIYSLLDNWKQNNTQI